MPKKTLIEMIDYFINLDPKHYFELKFTIKKMSENLLKSRVRI